MKIVFVWARTVLKLILPPSSLLILVIIGALLMGLKYRKSGKLLIILSLSALYLLSTSLVANFMIGPLESAYPPLAENMKDIDAVVVLSSGAKDLSHVGLGQVPGSESLKRLVHGIKIYRQFNIPRLVICGGIADPSKPGVSLGGVLAQTALDIGVKPDELVLEKDSKNTYEGALNLLKILKRGKKIILVTHARHMGRSVILHRKVGFDVIPAPSDYTGEAISVNIESFIPSAGSLCVSSEALYEYLSRSWYILKGFNHE
ncbi:MAG: YdcF family protein [Desulfobacterales bacterium]|nr:YdcF family protein [Desulfobacterales bacterium]